MEKAKATRSTYKGLVTRATKAVERYKAEDDEGAVKARLEALKETFKDFESAHVRFHEQLKESEPLEESEEYFFQVQDAYVAAMESAKTWLRANKGPMEVDAGKSTPAVKTEDALLQGGLLGMLTLPKLELGTFDGDPAKFHGFMSVFKEMVDCNLKDNRAKLARLFQYTSGKAKDAIRYCALMDGEEGYPKAMEILGERFGNDYMVTERIIRDLRKGNPVKSASDLRRLADDLSCSHMTLAKTGHLQELESQMCIVEIVSRLNSYLQNKWKRFALDQKRDAKKYPDFKDLVDFVGREASDANDPVYGGFGQNSRQSDSKEAIYGGSVHRPRQTERHRSDGGVAKYSTAFQATVKDSRTRWKTSTCPLCNGEHKMLYCAKFKGMDIKERIKFVRDRRLCENCLLDNHATVDCRKPSVCDVEGCGRKHTRYIHQEIGERAAKTTTSGRNNYVVSANNVSVDVDVFMPVVNVQVNDALEARVLLDSGSTNTFCTRSLIDRLGISGSDVNYVLSTLECSEEKQSKVVDLRVTSTDGSECLFLSHVFVVNEIPVKSAAIDVKAFGHLRGLPLFTSVGEVEILIGQDNAEALIPLDVRKGGKNEPFAVKTLLGWCINGPANGRGAVKRQAISNFVTASSLEEKVHALWQVENGNFMESDCWSQNDKAVVALWDEKCKLVEGHYQLPIPWRCKDLKLPNNLVMAQKRLKSLEQNLHKKGLKARYGQEMKSLMERGYAEVVPPDESNDAGRIWYLPHFAVISDKKPDKLRVVFDCAAKYCGQSLNSVCLQGPDINNRLLHVLLRFREHEFAISGDVEAMYHQILIPSEDRDALRFLWFDDEGKECHYRMTRHLFGGVWCSSSSSYALRRMLQDCDEVEPMVRETVLSAFYVDDCLKSTRTKEEAISVIDGTKSLLSRFGFKLTKFVANDPEILKKLPENERAKEVREFLPKCTSKALGVRWNVSNDSWYFDVSVDTEAVITRRHMLSFLASIFDPLGLVGPIIIAGKLLFQESTRLKLSWDEEIPREMKHRWELWVKSLEEISRFEIPRCIKPAQFDDGYLELHHFSDASQEAYGCCSYLRCVSPSGQIHVSLIMSKGRVAPLKQQSIARLELQAAVMAARIDEVLRSELHLTLGPSRFWTDSDIVLKYIKNDDKRFHVFVGNRVGEIRRLTNPSQWRHIKGIENPSDLVTRIQGSDLFESERWLQGPPFLKTFACDWEVMESNESLSDEDPEVKASFKTGGATCLVLVTDCCDPINRLFGHYSSWFRLKRAVGWLLRFKAFMRGIKVRRGGLSNEEVKRAESEILKVAQRQSYKGEIDSLAKGQEIPKGSRVRSLDPFVDGKGILRVGGRMRNLEAPEDTKNPILVPSEHAIASLIVREYHDRAHLGTEWIVSNVRSTYWITKIRRLVKRIGNGCVTCKRYFAPPCEQKMADLPPERLESGHPPFYYVGVDCFGPFLVKNGRSEVKRYGCLFTCLSTRAIHLEMLRNMDVDSFLNGFRRFVSRRGSPAIVWSDNGTNFVGGKAELERSLNDLRQGRTTMPEVKGIEWRFNPPSASHMGGLWERLIRTVRRVLIGLAGLNARLSDESLSTLFCEIEMIVNGRPITKVSDSVADPKALTPNHLLLLREGPTCPPGLFRETDLYKRRWRCVQHLTNAFWDRWRREYLSELQSRGKWLGKKPNIGVGDLVLIVKECTPRGVWPLGIVTEVYPGRDGLVRSAKVKTRATELVRPIVKLVLLEGFEKAND